jgi:hypothetical protein
MTESDLAPRRCGHAKMGMREVGDFMFDGKDYVVLSYVGERLAATPATVHECPTSSG